MSLTGEMSLPKFFIAAIIALSILVIGGLIILTIIGSLAFSFVQWLEANPFWRGVFALIGLVLIVILFLAFSKWLLSKAA